MLRDVVEGDLPAFFEHQADPDASGMATFESRDRTAFDAHWAKILRDDTVIQRTVLTDGRVASNLVLFGAPADIAEQSEREIEMHRRYSASYADVFFVMPRRGD